MRPRPVRVVLADMSRLHRDLIRRILEEEAGIEVVGEVPDAGPSLRHVVADVEADVIIIGSESEGLLEECRALLGELAPRRVIAVSTDAREAHLYGVRPFEAATDELSPDFVVDAVRNS